MRRRFAFDVETFKIQSGLLVPRLVCMSVSDGKETKLLDRQASVRLFRDLIVDRDVELVAHHAPYDLAVLAREAPDTLPAIFTAIEEGRARCTQNRQQLIDIAEDRFRFWYDASGRARKTKHSLDGTALRLLNLVLDKDPTIRTNFGSLVGVPIEEWPERYRSYARQDAEIDWKVAFAQDEYVGHEEFPTEVLQMKAAWALHLMSAWGIRTNPERVAKCREEWKAKRDELDKVLVKEGLVRRDGSKDTGVIGALVLHSFASRGLPAPITPRSGKIQLTKRVLGSCNDPLLRVLVERNKISKWMETYLPILNTAAMGPFNAGYRPLVKSGRTSCGGDDEDEDSETGNMQNLPRTGPVRECFESRPGTFFCLTDLDTAELRSVAEVCIILGIPEVVLAEEFKQGLDPHLTVAAELREITYEEALARKDEKPVADARDLAKIHNFGLWGGMGADAFVDYAKGFGVDLDLHATEESILKWKRHYREAPQYFRYIGRKTANGRATVRHPITGFVRAGCGFTDLANHYFQHLTACCAKDALYEITKECYLGVSSDGLFSVKKPSPLLGSRPVAFVHDEVDTEVPEWIAHEAAHRQAELMRKGADMYIKHVPNGSSMALTKNLHKKAKAVWRDGRLVPWEPPMKVAQAVAA